MDEMYNGYDDVDINANETEWAPYPASDHSGGNTRPYQEKLFIE